MKSTEERQRHPRLRVGERDPIDPYKRRLIYIRDGYSCQYCGWQLEPDHPTPGIVLQLDHVIPWSALGSDRSDNLRTLCFECNEERSNFVEPDPPRVLGVTGLCYWCAVETNALSVWWLEIDVEELDRIRVFCGHCSTTSWVPDERWIL